MIISWVHQQVWHFVLEGPTLLVDELPCAVDQVMEEAWNGFLGHEEHNKK